MPLMDSIPDCIRVWLPAAEWTMALSTTVRNGATQNVTPEPTRTSPNNLSPKLLDAAVFERMRSRVTSFPGAETWILVVDGKVGSISGCCMLCSGTVGVGMAASCSVCDRFIMVGEKIMLQRIYAQRFDFVTLPPLLMRWRLEKKAQNKCGHQISIVHRDIADHVCLRTVRSTTWSNSTKST